VDSYQARYIAVARLLWDASNGIPGDIPQDYCEHLDHEYEDGDISLVSLISKFESYSEMDDFEVEEAIELLGKVNPNDWPAAEDIEGVSLEELLRIYDKDATPGFDFVEDNLSTADRVEKSLIEVISSVFGDKVSTIRSEKGYYGNPKNNFLQDEDGTFSGTFMYEGKKFLFEVFPDENGWSVTYRLHWDEIDKIPPLSDADNPKKTDYTRQIRNRGWK
jgi:hypothetical protein